VKKRVIDSPLHSLFAALHPVALIIIGLCDYCSYRLLVLFINWTKIPRNIYFNCNFNLHNSIKFSNLDIANVIFDIIPSVINSVGYRPMLYCGHVACRLQVYNN